LTRGIGSPALEATFASAGVRSPLLARARARMSFIQPEVLATSTASSAAAAAAAQEELKRKPTDHLYWAKTSSVNAAPPPKQLTDEEAKQLEASSSGAGGSAWNKGGNTWEEKKINTWVHELLQSELLPAMAYELPTASTKLPSMPADEQGLAPDGLAVRVVSADKVTGDCTYVLSRGKQRVVFELELRIKLEVEVRAAGKLQTIVTGVLHVHEVTNDDLTQPKLPDAKLTCDQGAEWQSAFEYAAKQSWSSLKSVLEALVARAKEKWR